MTFRQGALAGALLLFGCASQASAAVYRCGSGGAYADLNACVAAAKADPAVISGGQQRQNITYQITTGGITTAVPQSVSGYTAGGHTTTITFDSSGGFRAALRAHLAAPLYFNPAYGGFILQNGNGVAGLTIDVANTTVFGIQIEQSTGSAFGIAFGGAATAAVVDSDIVVYGGATHTTPGIIFVATTGAVPVVKNTLVVGTNTDDTLTLVSFNGINSTDNTLVMTGPTLRNQGAAIYVYSGPATNIFNTAAMGFGRCGGGAGGQNSAYDFLGSGAMAGSNNATCFARFGGDGVYPGNTSPFRRDGQVSASTATEFVSATNYRLAPSSIHLRGRGKPAAAGITVDILGNPRNRPDDIGAIAYHPGPAKTPAVVLRSSP